MGSSPNKYAFHRFIKPGAEINTLMVVVRLAWHARPALNKWGMPAFIQKVKEEIPEVILVDPGHSGDKDIDITLKGPNTTKALAGGDKTALALASEVAQKLDRMVVAIID